MLMIKRMFNESDESVVSGWVENPYWQHFIRGDAFGTGEEYFLQCQGHPFGEESFGQHEQPFDPSEFVHFRKRIGPEALEMVLSATVKLHEGADKEDAPKVPRTPLSEGLLWRRIPLEKCKWTVQHKKRTLLFLQMRNCARE